MSKIINKVRKTQHMWCNIKTDESFQNIILDLYGLQVSETNHLNKINNLQRESI